MEDWLLSKIKKIPKRENPIYPPGALSARNFTNIAQPANYVSLFALTRYCAHRITY